MDKKQFWQSASTWGLICGVALFLVTLLSWGLKFPDNKIGWLAELLRFGVVFFVIFYTGRRNAALTGPEGYPYGRAVGFIFAMMLFTGIVVGVGQFLMTNFIAREYYDALNATQFETIMRMYQGTPMEDQMVTMGDQLLRMFSNPFYLIFSAVLEWVVKGGLLGLIMAAFVKKNPDVFSAQ